MNNEKKKHGILWWIGMILLWIVFFPIMFLVFIARSRKIPLIVKIPIILLHMVLWEAVFLGMANMDIEPPVIEAHEVTADYNTPIKLASLASITDDNDETPVMIISYCDPKAGTISKDGQEVTFSKVGKFKVRVEGSDSTANASTADIFVTIKDGTPPVIETNKTSFPVLEAIPVTDLGTVSDEIDRSPAFAINECVGNVEVSEDRQSITFKEPGEYKVELRAEDSFANACTKSVKVQVQNTIAPEIKMSEQEM